MTLVFPLLLGGLLLVGVPVLLHLIMRQKPKHLLFPAFRFLLQKHRTNQRKLRLRHLLLLLLRMLALAGLCFALTRPKFFSERFQLNSDRPAAAVLLFDTSASMEYAAGGGSRLDDAKKRALELLDELPGQSRVAILDTGEPGGEWYPTPALARDRVSSLKVRPANSAVTSRLAEAYRMLAELDQETEDVKQLARFLYVFSDRTSEAWDGSRVKDLQSSRDRSEQPIKAVFVDVGSDQPADLAIVSLELPRQVVTASERAVLRATVQATGGDYDMEVSCRIDGEATAERKPVQLKAGQSKVLVFERTGLKPGLHQAEVTLATADALPHNNARFATFEVRDTRHVLVLADDPNDAAAWDIALTAGKAFVCDVQKTDEARKLSPRDLAAYQVVCLLNVANPDDDLWDKLERYLQSGGGVAVLPGGEELKRDAYNGDKAQKLLPGKLVKVETAKDGVEWGWQNATYQHPLLKPFRDWNANPEQDFVVYPRLAFRYWQVEPRQGEPSTLVAYTDKQASPALLEGTFDRKKVKGKLLLFTTPLDGREPRWNNYLETVTSFYPVIAQLTARYLAGDEEEALFNFVCGQAVPVALPPAPRYPIYTLRGPGLGAAESAVPRNENQNEVLLQQATTPGNYTLVGGNNQRVAAFSLNVAPGESNLTKTTVDQIEALFDAGAVVPVGHSVSLRDALQGQWGQPVELLPWLLLVVLVALAVENFLANKFYRREAEEDALSTEPPVRAADE